MCERLQRLHGHNVRTKQVVEIAVSKAGCTEGSLDAGSVLLGVRGHLTQGIGTLFTRAGGDLLVEF